MAVRLSASLASRALPPETSSGTHFCYRLWKSLGRDAGGRVRDTEKMQLSHRVYEYTGIYSFKHPRSINTSLYYILKTNCSEILTRTLGLPLRHYRALIPLQYSSATITISLHFTSLRFTPTSLHFTSTSLRSTSTSFHFTSLHFMISVIHSLCLITFLAGGGRR
jgi:hypothetical protein